MYFILFDLYKKINVFCKINSVCIGRQLQSCVIQKQGTKTKHHRLYRCRLRNFKQCSELHTKTQHTWSSSSPTQTLPLPVTHNLHTPSVIRSKKGSCQVIRLFPPLLICHGLTTGQDTQARSTHTPCGVTHTLLTHGLKFTQTDKIHTYTNTLVFHNNPMQQQANKFKLKQIFTMQHSGTLGLKMSHTENTQRHSGTQLWDSPLIGLLVEAAAVWMCVFAFLSVCYCIT